MKKKLSFIIIWTSFLATSTSFGYQVMFTPRITVSEEYTDNFSQTNQNKTDDYITRITPGFTIQLPGGNIGADLSYDFGYVMYDFNSDRDRWEHRARFAGYSNLGRNTRLTLTDTFVYTPDPNIQNDIAKIRTETPDVSIDSTIRQGRDAYYRNITGLNLDYQFGKFGRSSSIRLGYVYRFLNNENPMYEDNKGHTYSAGLTYWFLPQWSFDVNVNYTRAEFDFSEDREILSGNVGMNKQFTPNFQGYIRYSQTNVNYSGVTADDMTINPSIGFNYSVINDISLSLDIGYFKNDFEFREDLSGLTVNGRLTKLFTRGYRTGSLNLSLLGGYDYSIWGAQNLGFEKYYEAAGSVTYQLTRLLNGNIFTSYRHSDYTDVIPERTDKIKSVGIGLAIQPRQWMSIGLNYHYRNVDSTTRSFEYGENRVILRISLTTPQPYRSSHF